MAQFPFFPPKNGSKVSMLFFSFFALSIVVFVVSAAPSTFPPNILLDDPVDNETIILTKSQPADIIINRPDKFSFVAIRPTGTCLKESRSSNTFILNYGGCSMTMKWDDLNFHIGEAKTHISTSSDVRVSVLGKITYASLISGDRSSNADKVESNNICSPTFDGSGHMKFEITGTPECNIQLKFNYKKYTEESSTSTPPSIDKFEIFLGMTIRSSNKPWIIAGIVFGASFLVLISALIVVCCYCYKKKTAVRAVTEEIQPTQSFIIPSRKTESTQGIPKTILQNPPPMPPTPVKRKNELPPSFWNSLDEESKEGSKASFKGVVSRQEPMTRSSDAPNDSTDELKDAAKDVVNNLVMKNRK